MNDDKAAIESEITDIRTNAENPLYQRFQNGEPQANEHVQNLYRRLHGVAPVVQEERRIEGEVSAEEEWELRAEIEQERQKREGEIDPRAIRETVDNTRWRLSQEWGEKADENWQIVNEFTAKMNGADFQRLALGLDSELKAEWVKLLYKTATATRRR